MAISDVKIILKANTQAFRKAIARVQRALLSLHYSWQRFFRREYWRTWVTTVYAWFR